MNFFRKCLLMMLCLRLFAFIFVFSFWLGTITRNGYTMQYTLTKLTSQKQLGRSHQGLGFGIDAPGTDGGKGIVGALQTPRHLRGERRDQGHPRSGIGGRSSGGCEPRGDPSGCHARSHQGRQGGRRQIRCE